VTPNGTPPPSSPKTPIGPAAGPTTPLGNGPTTPAFPLELGPDSDAWTSWWRFNVESLLDFGGDPLGPVSRADAAPTTGTPGLPAQEVVPVLTGLLEERALSGVVRAAVLLALGRAGAAPGAGTEDLEDLLRRHLADADRDVAETACAALGILGRPGAAPDLAHLLRDSARGRELCGRASVPDRTRSFAAYALGLLARRTSHADALRYASHALTETLADRRRTAPEVRVAALVALGRIDASSRPAAGAGCECASNEALAAFLTARLADIREETLVRAHVPDALGRLHAHLPPAVAERVTTDMLDALADAREDELVRRGCVLALGRIADADEDELDRRVRATLTDVARRERPLRGFVSIALARIGARPGTGIGAGANAHAVQVALTKRLASGNSTDVAWSALALGLLGHGLVEAERGVPDSLREVLRQGLEVSSAGPLVAVFALAAGLARDPAGLEGIAERLADLEGEDLGRAGLALGLLGNVEARAALQARLADGRHDPLVLADLATALSLLQDRELVDELARLLDDCACDSSRVAVAVALGRSRDARALAPLRELVLDPTGQEAVRACAALSLGALADPDERRWSAWLSSDLNYLANPASLTCTTAEGILDLP
jgi:HEAT repeat protein